MARVLNIECSPRKQDSVSIEVCRALLDACRETRPAETV
jgi:FMN-dependent NADH-azoreductase